MKFWVSIRAALAAFADPWSLTRERRRVHSLSAQLVSTQADKSGLETLLSVSDKSLSLTKKRLKASESLCQQLRIEVMALRCKLELPLHRTFVSLHPEQDRANLLADPGRRSGRTTRMLMGVLVDAEKGLDVYITSHSFGYSGELLSKVHAYAMIAGVSTRKIGIKYRDDDLRGLDRKEYSVRDDHHYGP